jgi:ATP-dependent RNA helicase DDX52/ROK1
VFDEADKLFEDGFKGFREQLAIIYKACDNPLIKHAMFSATYTKEVEEWSKLQLDNLIQVTIGRKYYDFTQKNSFFHSHLYQFKFTFKRNVATFSVEQELIYVGNEHGKLFSLRELFKKVISINLF